MTDALGSPARRSKGRLITFAVVLLLLVGTGVAGGVLWLDRDRGSDDDGAAAPPDEWDPRVEDLVAFVEEERGLEFDHPVHIDFLSEDEFEEEVTSEESDLTDEDKEEIERTSALMRALGLIDHDADLFELVNDLLSGGVVGLYDDEDKRIRMRGDELTPAVEATLVHELTHALQDQHFDLEAKNEELEDADDGAGTAWRALVEGDALRVENAYVAQLPPDQQQETVRDQQDQAKQARKRLEKVPVFLQTLIGSSYLFGEGMLRLVSAVDGEEAINALFEEPPATEEHLLDPWTLLADDAAVAVPEPELAEGEEEVDAGTFGATGLLFVLSERIDAKRALLAADGWGGDQFVAFDRGDRHCIRIDWRGDTRFDRIELETALFEWIRLGPDGTAKVRRLQDGLRFEACDPGRRKVESTGGSADALQLAAGRTAFAVQALELDIPQEGARCLANGVIREFTVEEFVNLNSPDADDAVMTRFNEVAFDCGSGG